MIFDPGAHRGGIGLRLADHRRCADDRGRQRRQRRPAGRRFRRRRRAADAAFPRALRACRLGKNWRRAHSETLFGAYDDNVAATLPGRAFDPRYQRSGWYSGANSQVQWNWRGERAAAERLGGRPARTTTLISTDPFVPSYSARHRFRPADWAAKQLSGQGRRSSTRPIS